MKPQKDWDGCSGIAWQSRAEASLRHTPSARIPPKKTPLQVAMLQQQRCSTSPSHNKLRGAFISGGPPGLAQRN